LTGSPSLTVIVSVFNQEREIGATLRAVARAVERSPFNTDLIVVDDGSTDGSADAARAAETELKLEVVRLQKNDLAPVYVLAHGAGMCVGS
jgi:glycosyltransferase involved in cell wall biosynthesis